MYAVKVTDSDTGHYAYIRYATAEAAVNAAKLVRPPLVAQAMQLSPGAIWVAMESGLDGKGELLLG